MIHNPKVKQDSQSRATFNKALCFAFELRKERKDISCQINVSPITPRTFYLLWVFFSTWRSSALASLRKQVDQKSFRKAIHQPYDYYSQMIFWPPIPGCLDRYGQHCDINHSTIIHVVSDTHSVRRPCSQVVVWNVFLLKKSQHLANCQRSRRRKMDVKLNWSPLDGVPTVRLLL